ncbi:family 16 glycosylhydrolase [Pontibacter sp. SGAir0037]|uniref:glycoside hydrolase family 16 protein n=1 Tax=Pontibacter sp. SGAir0037 TaxID=2571030 RepID=UPI001F0F323E|nr:glycoside hydrolase family 16 protein [Pontibacter sp. SGAir0037]
MTGTEHAAAPRLLWSDEFDYRGAPDKRRWTNDLGDGCPKVCGWGNGELQYYTKSIQNVRLKDHKLIIEARQQQRKNSRFTSARLKTQGLAAWQFGYIEVRAKLPAGRGTWPAIWMLPENFNHDSLPDGEIDIMEHVGHDPGVVHGTLHYAGENLQSGGSIHVPDFDTSFHRYGINWTADKIEYYLDGELYHVFENNIQAGTNPFHQRYYLLLNVAVGGGWGGREGIDPAVWPQRLEIDYVRVYEPLVTAAQKQYMFGK